MPELNKEQTVVYGELMEAHAVAAEWTETDSPIGAALLVEHAVRSAAVSLGTTIGAELLSDLAREEQDSFRSDLDRFGQIS